MLANYASGQLCTYAIEDYYGSGEGGMSFAEKVPFRLVSLAPRPARLFFVALSTRNDSKHTTFSKCADARVRLFS